MSTSGRGKLLRGSILATIVDGKVAHAADAFGKPDGR